MESQTGTVRNSARITARSWRQEGKPLATLQSGTDQLGSCSAALGSWLAASWMWGTGVSPALRRECSGWPNSNFWGIFLRQLCQALYTDGHGERTRTNGQKLKQQGQTGCKEKNLTMRTSRQWNMLARDLVPKYLGLISQLAMLFACSF